MEFFNLHQEKMDGIVSILDLVKSDEIKIHLVELICDRFPAVDDDTGEPLVLSDEFLLSPPKPDRAGFHPSGGAEAGRG